MHWSSPERIAGARSFINTLSRLVWNICAAGCRGGKTVLILRAVLRDLCPTIPCRPELKRTQLVESSGNSYSSIAASGGAQRPERLPKLSDHTGQTPRVISRRFYLLLSIDNMNELSRYLSVARWLHHAAWVTVTVYETTWGEGNHRDQFRNRTECLWIRSPGILRRFTHTASPATSRVR